MSLRSSGWRVLAWIEALKTAPMPAPAPAAPPPAPAPRAIASPAFLPYWVGSAAAISQCGRMARKWRNSIWVRLLLGGLVRRHRVAEVDRGQDGLDEGLQAGDE